MRKQIAWIGGLLVLGLATACGGGGGDVTNPGGGSSLLAASFGAGVTNPGAETVSMQQGTRSQNLVTVDVDVTDTGNIYGASFDVAYDPSFVEYVNWSAGTLLEQGGNTPLYQVTRVVAGRLVIGASRTGSASEVSATGSQTLIRLTFRVVKAGTSAAAFENPKLENAAEQALPMGGGWHGGQFQAI